MELAFLLTVLNSFQFKKLYKSIVHLLANENELLSPSTRHTIFRMAESLSRAEGRAILLLGRYAISPAFIGPVGANPPTLKLIDQSLIIPSSLRSC